MPVGQQAPSGGVYAAGPSFVPFGAPRDPAGWGQTAVGGGPVTPGVALQLLAIERRLWSIDMSAGFLAGHSDRVPEDQVWSINHVHANFELATWSGDGSNPNMVLFIEQAGAALGDGLVVGGTKDGAFALVASLTQPYLLPGERFTLADPSASPPGTPPPTVPCWGFSFERHQILPA